MIDKQHLIDLKGVSKEFDGTRVLSNIDLYVRRKEFVTLLGPSGCGKSTYLRLLNGTLLPDKGTVRYEGRPLASYDILSYRKKVLRVPQEPFLFEGTIKENFEAYYGVLREKPPYLDQMREALRRAALPISIETDCRSLSGGERQRAYLALFLSFSPDVLLLDEPTASLDEDTARTLFHSLKEESHQTGRTLLCVCHDTHLTHEFADATIFLAGGHEK